LLLCLALCPVLEAFHTSVGGLHWSSWDNRQICQPVDLVRPRSEEGVAKFVADCNAHGEPVKVVGAGHSFSSIALVQDGGHMLSLDLLRDIIHVDRHVGGSNFSHVTVGAGIRLYELNTELEKLGLALQNLGATAEQSLAGATATGTHGTGDTGSLSAAIVGARLIVANGTVIDIDASSPDLLAAVRVNLGALGIVTRLTLQVVDIWRMRLDMIPYDLDTLMHDLPHLLAENPRLQWFWTPYTPNATLVLRTPTDAPITGCWDQALDLETGLSAGTSCVDVSYKTMTGSRDHYFTRSLYTEMEMFVPSEELPHAISDFRSFQASVVKKHSPGVKLFTGVRYVEADDSWMSPQYKRSNAVISMIVTGDLTKTGAPDEFSMYGHGLEEIAVGKYDGRPHWGKMNYATAEDISRSYPKFDDFTELRSRLDPQGIFLNAYLVDRLVGRDK